ncbi:MAG: nucleotidyltransferase family protein [Acidobacteria bacterium]|nr:nucleotidyltransferase family protein [Acidobacteriota bacterium]
MRIDGIILAAGLSTRFGRPKQLAEWRGQPLILHAAETALGSRLRNVIVVIGHVADQVRAALNPVAERPNLKVVYNPEYEEGRASSIRYGLKALPKDAPAAMFLAGDQPLIGPELINALIDTFIQRRPLICYPVSGLTRSNPTIFAAALFPELMRLTGDVGGSALIEKYKSRVCEHPIPSLGTTADVDQEDDFQSLP